jgi:hypothetical protein
MDDYSWIDTWGMDTPDAGYYGDLANFGDYNTSWYDSLGGSFDQFPDFSSFEDMSNILEFVGPEFQTGDSGWQINSVDVPWTEGTNYDFSTYADGSDWKDTGIFAPLYEAGLKSAPDVGSSKSPLGGLNSLLGKLFASSKETSDSPLGKTLLALAGMLAKRQQTKLQDTRKQGAINTAAANSQHSLGTNRNTPYKVEQRDPYSYVAQAPTKEV